MRIFLQLEAIKDCEYDIMYFHKLQGFVYSLLKETEYNILHDKKGYKFFCFSNIFPVGTIKIGDIKNLLISSPDHLFVKFLEEELKKLVDSGKAINIGEMLFKVENVSLIKTKLGRNCRLISATPIVIRIPEKNYDRYDIPQKFRKKRYVYWRPCYSFEAFIKQLEENLIKKYNEFYRTDIEEFPVFEQFIYKKSTCNHVVINYKEQKLISSVWEFIFSHMDKERKKLLEFGLDCGFGERNSLGFGFMNVIKKR